MTLEIGRSGLNTAMRALDRAAFDIARASAPRGAGAGAVASTPAAPGTPAAPVAPPAPGAGPDLAPAAEIDLPRAMIDLMAASNAALANLQTIRRTDERLEAMLKMR
jgi:hypothetical protein